MDQTETDLLNRINAVEHIFISYPRLRGVVSGIERCRARSLNSEEAECCLVTGETGAGKTTIIRHYLQSNPRAEMDSGTVIPVFAASIPARATIKGVVSSLLYALKDAFPDRGTVVSQTFRLYGRLRSCRVELLIIDEFQHLLDRGSSRILMDVADWIKMLVNETGIPVILVGMPWATGILECNPQLRRRFSRHLQLLPFNWHDTGDRDDFLRFLAVLDQSLPFKSRSGLATEDLALRLYRSSGGSVGHLMKLARNAAIRTLESGKVRMDREDFAAAFEETVCPGHALTFNPFSVTLTRVKSSMNSSSPGKRRGAQHRASVGVSPGPQVQERHSD